MRFGQLDRRIVLQRKTTVLSASGQPTETWANLATVAAGVAPVSGREGFSVPQIVADADTKFTVRWSSAVDDVSPLDRVLYAGRLYDIAAVQEIGRREGLMIVAKVRADNAS